MREYREVGGVGSSKTHALIVDETGQCVGFGKSGGGNHQGVGYDGTEKALHEFFGGALKMSGVEKAHIVGAGFGVAGYDFPSDRESHLMSIAGLGLTCPVEIVNDCMNGLLAGAQRRVGVNITAGSSNNVRGRNKYGKEGRIVGNGSAFGENGVGLKSFNMDCKRLTTLGSNASRQPHKRRSTSMRRARKMK